MPEPVMQGWGSASVSREERTAFLEELTAGNLRRMFWFILVCLPISLWIAASNQSSWHKGEIDPWSIFDLACSFAFLGLNVFARKRGGALWWTFALVLAYYAYCLASMTGYYFATLASFGENLSYTLGIMMVAVLFRIPPRWFLALLLVNHLVFSWVVYFSEAGRGHLIVSMVGGFDAFLVGCLAAYFLFTKEWHDFQKGRLLAERNREMAGANVQLRRHNEEMREIMAIAAHDLRNPLVNIKGLFELLQARSEWQREPYRNVLDECGQACGGMLDLIKRLLDAHAAEHGGNDLCLQKASAQGLVETAAKRFSAMAEVRGIRIETDFAGDDFQIETDPGAMEQAIDNLLSNAIKFSPAGSRVTIALSRTGDVCLIEVADEGPGIPEAERGLLFGKFRKGSNRPANGVSGAGLGLFIVRQVMGNLAGSVSYEPRFPRGSLFRLEMPFARGSSG